MDQWRTASCWTSPAVGAGKRELRGRCPLDGRFHERTSIMMGVPSTRSFEPDDNWVAVPVGSV